MDKYSEMEVEEEQPRMEMVDGHAGQNSLTSGNVSIIINLYGMDASVAGTGMPIGLSSNSRGVIITMQSAHPIALDENVGDTVSKKKSNVPSNESSEAGYEESTTYSFTEDFEELEEIDEDVEVISESAFDSAIRFSSEMEVDEEQPITEMTDP